jgi:SPP1 family predicted phage head-tail adaptor
MNPERVDPGQMNRRAAFVRDVISRDDDGSEIRTPATIATRWAYVECQAGRERFAAQQTISEGDWQVVTRYFTTAKASDRIEVDGHTLQITAIVPDAAGHRWIEFRCREANA